MRSVFAQCGTQAGGSTVWSAVSDDVLLGCVPGLGQRALVNCRGSWLVQVWGRKLLAACSAERWCVQSIRHRGQAVGRCSSLLDVLERANP